MSHISGHWEQLPAMGAASNPFSLGIISLQLDRNFKLLFFNNAGTSGLKPGDPIGFHLQLIPIANLQCDGAQYFGIAYDVVPLNRHQDLDAKAEKSFHKKIEDAIGDPRLDLQALRNTLSADEKMVYDQTEDYKKTNSYKILYERAVKYDYEAKEKEKAKGKGEEYDASVDRARQLWIIENVKSYEPISILQPSAVQQFHPKQTKQTSYLA